MVDGACWFFFRSLVRFYLNAINELNGFDPGRKKSFNLILSKVMKLFSSFYNPENLQKPACLLACFPP